MSLVKLDACCECADHQRPYVNEDGWVLTGLPDDSNTWEAWRPAEWKRHCTRYTTQGLVPLSVREEIAHRLTSGESAKDLAAEYEITPDTVRRYRRKYARKVAA